MCIIKICSIIQQYFFDFRLTYTLNHQIFHHKQIIIYTFTLCVRDWTNDTYIAFYINIHPYNHTGEHVEQHGIQ